MPATNPLYIQKIKHAGISNTAARYAVFEALYNSGHEPLTMHQLVDKVAGKADRASVYRSVKLLEEIGIINKLQIGWKYKLELSDDFHGHHHHLTCIKCNKTHATDDNPAFEKYMRLVAGKHGFDMTDHHLDIRGICAACKKKNPAL